MRTEQLLVFLVLVTARSANGRHIREQGGSLTKNAADEIGSEDGGGVFEDETTSRAQLSKVRQLRQDGNLQEGYLKFNGRSLDVSTDKDNMVEKGLEEESPQAAGGWGLPSIGTVAGWAKNAYSRLPSYKTAASYVPAPLQQYVPSQETIDLYKPSIESIKTQFQVPIDYMRWRVFGNYKFEKLLTLEERNRVIEALKARMFHKEGGENVEVLINELSEKVAARAENNMTPVVIKVVVNKVVYAYAIIYIGPYATYLLRAQIDVLANKVSDQAIAQYLKMDPDKRVNLYHYVKKINWRAVFDKIVGIVNSYAYTTQANNDAQ